jgi:hypothetical protein
VDEPLAAIAFDELAIQEMGADLPVAGALAHGCHPVAEMSRQSVEAEFQAMAGKGGQVIGSQYLDKGMDDGVCHGLSAGSDLEHREELGEGIERDPNP